MILFDEILLKPIELAYIKLFEHLTYKLTIVIFEWFTRNYLRLFLDHCSFILGPLSRWCSGWSAKVYSLCGSHRTWSCWSKWQCPWWNLRTNNRDICNIIHGVSYALPHRSHLALGMIQVVYCRVLSFGFYLGWRIRRPFW